MIFTTTKTTSPWLYLIVLIRIFLVFSDFLNHIYLKPPKKERGYDINVWFLCRLVILVSTKKCWKFFNSLTLPETNSSPLKMDGWKTILSFWDGLVSGSVPQPLSFNRCHSWAPRSPKSPRNIPWLGDDACSSGSLIGWGLGGWVVVSYPMTEPCIYGIFTYRFYNWPSGLHALGDSIPLPIGVMESWIIQVHFHCWFLW